MATGSALLRLIMIAISLVSSIVFGKRLEKRPPHSFPLEVTLEPAASSVDIPKVVPTASAQTSKQGCVTTEQAPSIVASPGPTATITSTHVTSTPKPGSTDCGPCHLFFQVSQQCTYAQLMTEIETAEHRCTLLVFKPYKHQLSIAKLDSCISYYRVVECVKTISSFIRLFTDLVLASHPASYWSFHQ